MSISQLKGIIESHKGEDLSKLKMVVAKLDDHLKNTNAKLANLRHQIRLETSPKSRETYLKKSHTMVWEQQTIRRILEDYKKKLTVLVANSSSKEDDKKQRQAPTRNDKLFELFKNNDLDTENNADKVKDTKSADSIEVSESGQVQAKKRKLSGELDETEDFNSNQSPVKNRTLSGELKPTDVTEDSTATLLTINTHAEALKHLTALQEYAMMNDNFRATGLLIQVEKAFINPPNSTDFEL